MTRPELTTKTEANRTRHTGRLRPFARDEDGAMIVFGLMIFTLMLAMGGLAFDLMRYEAVRERVQATQDRAVLAAASLTQKQDPKTVVLEYFAKAGMADYIDPDDITVVEGLNSRMVSANAKVAVPLHHGDFAVFSGSGNPNNTLMAAASSTAMESIGNVEISMVLDVSGSMNSYNRLTNLKSAAGDFLDIVYDSAEPFSVSTSIIPYATQVNAGETLLSYFNRNDSHDISHCLNWTSNQFNSVSVTDHLHPSINPSSTAVDQTIAMDPWTNESNGFDVGEEARYPVCPWVGHSRTANREILAWSTSKQDLKDYVNAFKADGNTSTDIGVKWGVAMLDPSTQPVLSGMVGSGDVANELDGRPFNYDSGDSLKILVVMTDGAHTSQGFMDDHRSGLSFVWRHVVGDDSHYYIWHDGANSTPDPNIGTTQVCTRYRWNGSCRNWSTNYFWFDAYNTDTDGGGYTRYNWVEGPHADAEQLTWAELFADIPPEVFSDDLLYEMGTLTDNERNTYEYAIDFVGYSTKNGRFDNICQAAKNDDNIIIFAIGLEVSSSNAARLKDCASSPGHYFDVDNLDISYAFKAIASKINQLRLTQ